MNREEAIDYIENLYPADSEYPKTAENGKRLLKQARQKSQDGERNQQRY